MLRLLWLIKGFTNLISFLTLSVHNRVEEKYWTLYWQKPLKNKEFLGLDK